MTVHLPTVLLLGQVPGAPKVPCCWPQLAWYLLAAVGSDCGRKYSRHVNRVFTLSQVPTLTPPPGVRVLGVFCVTVTVPLGPVVTVIPVLLPPALAVPVLTTVLLPVLVVGIAL